MLRSATALALLLCSSLAFAQSSAALEDKELKPLAKGFSKYFASRAEDSGTDEARVELEEALAAILGDEHPLRKAKSLARALWLSRDYQRTKLRKGKIETATAKESSFAAGELSYSYRVPRDYEPDKLAYPLVLAIGAIKNDRTNTFERIGPLASSAKERSSCARICRPPWRSGTARWSMVGRAV